MSRICSSYFNLQKNHVVVLNLTIKSDAYSKFKMLAFSPICNSFVLRQVCCDLWLRHGSTAYSSMAMLWRAPNFLLNGSSLVHLKEQERVQRRHCRGLSLRSLKRYSWIGRHWPNRRRSARLQRICGLIWYTLCGGEAEAKHAPGQSSARSNRIMCLQRMIRLQCIVRHLHQNRY